MTASVSGPAAISGSAVTTHPRAAAREGGALARAVAPAWTALALLCFGHLAVDSCTGVWPVYKTLAGVDLSMAGWIATGGSFIGNGLQVLFGALADRGFRRVLLVGGVAASSAVLAVSVTDRPWLYLVLVLATSVGSAAFHPAGAGAAGSMSGRRKGLFVALFLAGGYVGFAFSQLLFTAAFRYAPPMTLSLALLPLIGAVGLAVLGPAEPRPVPRTGARSLELRKLGPLVPLFVIQVLASATNLSLIFLLPDLMLACHAPRWMVEGGGHAALILGGCLALVPAGVLCDRFGVRWVLGIANLLAGISLAILLVNGGGAGVLLAAVTLFGLFNGANNVAVVAEGNRLLPDHASGVSSLLMGLPWCFAALAPALAGALADPASGGTPVRALAWLGLTVPLTVVASACAPKRATTSPVEAAR